jgi:hypothetical protein
MTVKQQQRRDQSQVEQDRRRRIDPEFVQRIEDAPQQRHKADQHQIGNGETRQLYRKGELVVRHAVEPARQRQRHGPGEQLEDDRHDDQDRQQHRQHVLREGHAGRQARPVLVGDLAVEHRDERSRECSFGEQRAEHVGESKGDEEGIRREARADKAREQRIAHQA